MTWDEAKRQATLRERGLDFADAELVFATRRFYTRPDKRRDYGEMRNITVGYLSERFVVIVWTGSEEDRRIISIGTGMSGKKSASATIWIDPDDAPELTDEWFEGADLYEAGKLIRRGGRPKKAAPKEAVNIRLDPDVVAHFRAGGRGWQSRINAALRKVAGL